jgi:cell division protein ZipA
MDIGLKEWLIIGGILVIGLIIFDGWRRMKGQRNTLKIDIDRDFTESDDNDVATTAHNPELPNGGARALQEEGSAQPYAHVTNTLKSTERIDPGFDHINDFIEPATEIIAESRSQEKKASKIVSEPTYQQPESDQEDMDFSNSVSEELDPLFDDIPEILSPIKKATAGHEHRNNASVEKTEQQGSDSSEYLDLEQPITVLMRQTSEKLSEDETPKVQDEVASFPDVQKPSKEHNDHHSESSFDTAQELQETKDVTGTVEDKSLQTNKDSTSLLSQEEFLPAQDSNLESDEPDTASLVDDDESVPEQSSLLDGEHLEHARTERKAREQSPEPEEVLVITVVGKQQPLDGQTLLQVGLACGMRFGDMSLFHRFEEGVDTGPVQFSMANAVNPGTFDLEHMSEMTTPGVSFFMSMNEPADAKNAFECMLATAETVSKHLGGDLLDENRSVMRPQTKAHYRERIREFEMHKLHSRNLS